MVTLNDVLPATGSLTTIHDAAIALTHIEAYLHSQGDLRGAFASMYLVVTRRVALAVEDPCGPFNDAPWISTLAARFASRYIATLRMSSTSPPSHDCRAWSLAYEACETRLSPLRCATLGLSAHILADLAVGIASLLVEEGPRLTVRQVARHKADHDAVNVLLEASTGEVLSTLAMRYGCALSARLAPLTRGPVQSLALTPLRLARGQVWHDAVALVGASSLVDGERVRRRIFRTAGRVGAGLAMRCPALV